MGVLEQMTLHLPVHVYIQACLRYMHMARDCAAPPAGTHPETALLMWQSNGAHARYLILT